LKILHQPQQFLELELLINTLSIVRILLEVQNTISLRKQILGIRLNPSKLTKATLRVPDLFTLQLPWKTTSIYLGDMMELIDAMTSSDLTFRLTTGLRLFQQVGRNHLHPEIVTLQLLTIDASIYLEAMMATIELTTSIAIASPPENGA
jgi:hypothetical protein